MYKKLALFAVAWTFALIVLGAYVRLSDAGLGCPDWPGCYGKATPVHAMEDILAAHAQAPTGPVSLAKAWKEMVHRYAATLLGVMAIVLAVMAVRQRESLRRPPWLAIGIVLMICWQGAFGAWTVTLKLRPAIVTGHLAFGLATLGLLVWHAMRQREWPVLQRFPASLRPLAMVGLLILAMQILLGGWVSTNYAALACIDFPSCGGALVPEHMRFTEAFSLARELGQTSDGQMLTMADITAIQWLHRLGALITFCYVSLLAFSLYRRGVLRSLALAIAAALLLQVTLGIANVLFQLPLVLAVMHNAGAALLLCLMIALNYRLALSR
ncbi:heme A synthase [Chitinimonas sp.]|uniref:COX15/CtaA family protein n=1 Tax=Chitinimonas sp. TaxID=1934313 RepID=UPI0035B1EFC4